MTKLNATIFDFGTKNESCIRFNEVLNCLIKFEDGKTKIYFSSKDDALKWTKKMTQSHHDRGILVGSKNDSLIKKYSMFRINEKLYHILWYIMEDKLIYDETTGEWTSKIKNIKSNKYANEWLKEYNL
uniref:Uncharacterized protein n=1 Tax=Pithovirus LCPAC001 TaxID=2506585 RepID=A0A481Z1K3_9VIRU|nr:MAG: hypothetical protein LCPAC001_00430 [Pithovirus LCPAC001]